MPLFCLVLYLYSPMSRGGAVAYKYTTRDATARPIGQFLRLCTCFLFASLRDWMPALAPGLDQLMIVTKVPFDIGKPQLRPSRSKTRVTPDEKRRFLAWHAQEIKQQRCALFNTEIGAAATYVSLAPNSFHEKFPLLRKLEVLYLLLSKHSPFNDLDLLATHARTFPPAALASVSFGFVLVGVRLRYQDQSQRRRK